MLPSNIGLAGLILWAGLSSVLATDALIPPPLGPYSTLITTTMLTDVIRLDPFAPTNTSRVLMVSVYSPIPSSQCSNLSSTEYMPDKTANFYDQTYGPLGIPVGTFESLKLQVCTQIHRKYRPRQYPVVLFSPGLGNSRLEYGAIAQSVASNGYIVISIDHTYDASIVEFPDGSVILGADIETEEQITFALAVRAQDVTFVLNQLRIPSFSRSFFLDSSCQLNIKNVGIFGHSLGGATALASMANDTRLSGGVNLDGTFFGPAIQQGTKRPFLLVGHEGKNQSTDPSWGATWPELKAWKLELEVLGTQHGSFTDLPLLVDVLGLAPYLPPAVIELLGSITGPRSLEIMRVFVGAFFDKVLRGEGSEILRKATPAYPEVVFIAKSN